MLTGLYFGIRASSRHDDAVASPIQRDADQLQRSAERSATIANVMFAAGSAVIVGGIAWKVLQLTSSDDDSAQTAPGAPR